MQVKIGYWDLIQLLTINSTIAEGNAAKSPQSFNWNNSVKQWDINQVSIWIKTDAFWLHCYINYTPW